MMRFYPTFSYSNTLGPQIRYFDRGGRQIGYSQDYSTQHRYYDMGGRWLGYTEMCCGQMVLRGPGGNRL